MEYIKDSSTLIANRLKMRILPVLPRSAKEGEVVLVVDEGFYIYHNNIFIVLVAFNGSLINFIGEIRMEWTTLNDDDWLYCDGSTFNEDEYPGLYMHLGSNILPDLREAHLVGVGQNDTDNIAEHDVFTLGQVKDRQIQGHKHLLSETTHNHSLSTETATGSGSHTHSGFFNTSGSKSIKMKGGRSYGSWSVKPAYDVRIASGSSNYNYGMGNSSYTSTPSVGAPSNVSSGDHLRTDAIGVKYYIRAKK